jgi:peptidoglycan/LPS O-acetylase OafA/YrhL
MMLIRGRIPGLDGIRAIAIIFVMASHCNIPGARGGGFGVDAFFVLSGYLITRILTREFELTGGINLTRFYGRRFLRLGPPLIAMVFVVTTIAVIVDRLDGKTALLHEALPSVLYVANFTKIFFNYPHSLHGHTWSLAVEEQFYLIWPLVLVTLLSVSRKSALIGALTIAAASALWRGYLVWSGVKLAYWPAQGFDTRCDALLVGSALALVSLKAAGRLGRGWLPALVLAVLCSGLYHYGMRDTYYGIGVVFEVSIAVLIAKIITDDKAALTRTLNWGPLAELGRISYAFYLWHVGIILAFQHAFGLSRIELFLAAFPFAVGAAVASDRLLESRLRRLGGSGSRCDLRDACGLIPRRLSPPTLP